jgi:hypothetical protein
MVSNDDLFIISMGCICIFFAIYWLYKINSKTIVPISNPIFPNIIQPNIIQPNISPTPNAIPIVSDIKIPPTLFPDTKVPDTPAPDTKVPDTPVPPVKELTFLLMGQSNCANWGESTMTSTKAKVFNNGKLFDTASDPLPGSDGTRGSVWTRLVNMLDSTKYKIVLIPTAVGGTSINRWLPSANDLFANVTTQVNAYKKTGGVITHVLWHQGESDVSMNPNEYKTKFTQIATSLNTLTSNAKIYVSQATYCSGNSSDSLRTAQAELGKTYNTGPNTDTLGPNTRYDNCHFNKSGLEQFATLWKIALNL